MKLISAAAFTALSLVGVACGTESSTLGTSVDAPPSTPRLPADDPLATDVPVAELELPVRPIEVDDGAPDSIERLGDSADLIVVATVSEETSLGRPQATDDPSADEFTGLTLRVDSVLKGQPVAQLSLGWDAYAVDSNGTRVATNVINGIPVPHLGDQLLLFLRPVDDQFAALLGGFPTHTPVALDGVGFVQSGMISITDSTSQDAAQLLGRSIDQIAAQL